MKNSKMVVLAVWIFVLPLIALFLQDAMASETSRWGITTKKQLEKDKDTPIDNSGLETQPATQEGRDKNKTEPVTSKKNPSMNASPTKHPEAIKKKAAVGDSNKSTATSQKTVPGQNTATPAAKVDKPTTQAVIWANEKQKTTCQTYIKDLRQRFVKTRHYSIQGAPCKTRDFATAFLHVKEKCIKDCPEGFLRQSGYTDRIIRNITYLEKLGNDRCSDTTATPPMPKTN